MPDAPVPSVLRQLRRTLARSDSGASDAQLLERFLAHRDEDAFELLVWRHERLVLSVCRRILNDPHDAEDAFQATFLTLVRRGSSIARGQALASWLYQVACRIALRVRAGVSRRAGREQKDIDFSGIPAATDGADVERRELGSLLDEEIGQLPEKYRAPIVLCFLQGHTYDEAARRLGCPLGTLSTRLTQARARLRARLARRGVGLGAAALATILCERAATAAVPGMLVTATVKAAASVAAGQAATGIAPQVVALTEGALRTMWLSKLRFVGILVLAVSLLGGGAALLTSGAPALQNAREDKALAQRVPVAPKTDQERLQGTWLVVSMNRGKREATPEECRAERVVFTGKVMTRKTPTRSDEVIPYTLDPTKKPKTIDFGRNGIVAGVGIYEFKGDTLQLCFERDVDHEPRPTDFKAGRTRIVLVLKRAKDTGPPKKPSAPVQRTFKTDKERLQGTWLVVSLNEDNREQPEKECRIYQFIFAGDRMTMKKGDRRTEEYTYQLAPKATPKGIDLKDARRGRLRAHAIYEFTGDRLRLCLDDDDAPRPTDFKPGKRRVIVLLKRAKSVPVPAGKGATTTDKERFQGIWKVASRNEDNREASAEQCRLRQFIFSGDRMRIIKGGVDIEEDASYQIDSTQKPRTIDITSRGHNSIGIYEFNGDRLRLCVTDADQPRPTDFKPGKGRTVIVLEHASVPKPAEEVIQLKAQVQKLHYALEIALAKNADLTQTLKKVAESEARKDEIAGLLTKVDASNRTLSLTLGRTKLALTHVPLAKRVAFFRGSKECTINDLKPGMEVTLRLETNGNRSEIVRIEAKTH